MDPSHQPAAKPKRRGPVAASPPLHATRRLPTWRLRFMMRVRLRLSSPALSDALFMAFMRAASSEASASCSERSSDAFM